MSNSSPEHFSSRTRKWHSALFALAVAALTALSWSLWQDYQTRDTSLDRRVELFSPANADQQLLTIRILTGEPFADLWGRFQNREQEPYHILGKYAERGAPTPEKILRAYLKWYSTPRAFKLEPDHIENLDRAFASGDYQHALNYASSLSLELKGDKEFENWKKLLEDYVEILPALDLL